MTLTLILLNNGENMGRLLKDKCDPITLSPLTLAFVGDGVFDLMVRERLVCAANAPVGSLNQKKVGAVCCKSQAEIMQQLMPILTDEELSVFKRGRNAHTSHTPKNATNSQYHSATGFEALWGYIYLKGDIDRLNELFEKSGVFE